jgi:hypothetical protein
MQSRSLDDQRVRETLAPALRILGFDIELARPEDMLAAAVAQFDVRRIPSDSLVPR